MCLDASLGFKLLEKLDFQTKLEELLQQVLFEVVLGHWQVVQPGALEPAGSEAGSLSDLGFCLIFHLENVCGDSCRLTSASYWVM